MFTRSIRAGSAAAALAVVALAATVAPALADPPSGTTPADNDLVGVGSDTTQFAVGYLADGTTVSGEHVNGYNQAVATGATDPKIRSFDACTVAPGTQFPCTPGGNITVRSGHSIVRPNGSGAGKSLLYGANNDEAITFARSSSGLSTAEQNASLKAYPFARDTLVMVTSKNTATNAPATLTGQNILDIYTGTVTNWSQIDPTKSGLIKPYIPQTGSGTRSFFLAQLQVLNGGQAPTLAASVTEAQEHDPTLIQNDANAIAPFSLGRANLAGTVQVEKGWKADRAVYNVVRGTDATHPEWQAGSTLIEGAFGQSGFFCSPAARPLIEAAGFKQLQSVADGGACGQYTGSSTSNLAVYDEAGTPSNTAMTYDSSTTTYGQAAVSHITVTGAGGTPSGKVTVAGAGFSTDVPLDNTGKADFTLPADVVAGTNTVTATYSGDDVFAGSSKTTVLTVNKAAVTLTDTFGSSVAKGKKATGKVKAALDPTSTVLPTGTVKVTRKGVTYGSGKLVDGKVTITLKALPKGKNNLVITLPSSANTEAATLKITITQK